MLAEQYSAKDGFVVHVHRQSGAERAKREALLVEAGFQLPMVHRDVWAARSGSAASWFFDVRDRAGVACGGFAVAVNPSRALPGHLLLRVERFGSGVAPRALGAALDVLVRVARRGGRVLRVNVETFSRDSAVRASLDEALAKRGFAPAGADRRRYIRTIAVSLGGSEDDVFASFHKKVRRDIRLLVKHPVEIRPVDDARWAQRMADLMRETMTRTSGPQHAYDWPGRIAFTRANPALACLLGLFRTDREDPGSLLSFAWSCSNVRYAHYDAAASTRDTDLKVPLNYGLLWELMRWAKRNGAQWFDMGGVTAGHTGDGVDRLGGISDFKRYFGGDEIEVGGEWVLETARLRAGIARLLGRAAGWASNRERASRGPAHAG